MKQPSAPEAAPATGRWAKVIDHESCIGCHACTTACKSENDVPLSVTRTYVKYADVGTFPNTRRAFQVTRCNQCEDAPCVEACPTSAMYQRGDGIVDFDKNACIGCKACIAACPYDAIFINPEDHSAEKCNFCTHRLDIGLEPACVVVCPTEAILVGDLEDPTSKVAQMVGREPLAVRRPEKNTRPKLFYRGAHQATLDPLAARRPDGGLFLWSEQRQGGHHVVSGHPSPERATSSAAAVLSYDVSHTAPWDWRVSLYTLTKGIAAGVYLVGLGLLGAGTLDPAGLLWQWLVPLAALFFLAVTGGLLIWDLEHPARFYLIFLRPQWRSWLVRGGFILGGYGLVLAAHLVIALAGAPELLPWLALPGALLAAATAVYTAYLFAQAKARDLWQSPLLPPHLLVQAVLAGA
ncbi:MAG: 4Fe-4S dicluster domain-containing protein, partial [Acidobacteriota bacterium]|nr:4Fe-4S dicluster domain-containing protein [Acidobacteriota bacterium]